MPLSHSKPWYSIVDIDSTALSLDVSNIAKANASSAWVLKQLLIAGTVGVGTTGWTGAIPGTSLWTVIGSSDGSTAGLDGIDRWGSTFNTAKLVTNLSWIVLKHPTTNWYLQIGCNVIVTTGIDVRMYFQATAPTGGNATTLPTWTAPALYSNFSDGYMQFAISSVANRYHFTIDAGGSFWFAPHSNGKGAAAFGFQQLTSVPTTDTNPYAFCPLVNSDNYRSMISTTAVVLGIRTSIHTYLSGVGTISSFNMGTRTNSATLTLDGKKLMVSPVTLTPTTMGQYAEPKGVLPDAYIGFYGDALASVPDTGNCYFAQCNGPATSNASTIISSVGGMWLPFTARPTPL